MSKRKHKEPQEMGPYQQGIRIFFDKKYMWIYNSEGRLTLHGLHRPAPKDKE